MVSSAGKTRQFTFQDHVQEQRSARKRRLEYYQRISWSVAIGIVTIFLLATIAVQITERDQIRSSVEVFGVDVSGMTREHARETLQTAESQRAEQALQLADGEQQWQATAVELGLRMDIDGALDEAFDTGRSGIGLSRLAILWHLKSQPTDIERGHVAIASDVIDSRLNAIAPEINQPRVDPVLELTGGEYSYTSAQVGRTLDIDASTEAVINALSEGATTVKLIISEDHPAQTNEQYAQANSQLNNILDAPIVLTGNGASWTFEPASIASRLQVTPASGSDPAQVEIDPNWAWTAVNEIRFGIDHAPQSPRVWWNASGALYVKDQPKDGAQLNFDEALQMVSDAFSGKSDSNTVELPVTILPHPAVPADLNALGLNGVFAESTTAYGYSIAARKHNIELAAQILNGVLVMPGQTFSFNSEIGPMTLDAGFQIAYGIVSQGGELNTIPTEAGGICQVATTVFQPAFAAGYRIDQRTGHSYWIDHYTYNGIVGLDSTVDPAAGLDLKWTNDSNHAILIQAKADGEDFMVRFIGQQPDWQVQIQDPVIQNIQYANPDQIIYQPDTTLDPGKTLRVENAQDGFDATVTRVITTADGQEYSEDLKTSYGPAHNVVVVGSENGELPPGYAPVSN